MNKTNALRNIVAVILLVLCVLEFRAFFIDVRDVYTEDHTVQEPQTITVNEIAPWMTFSYLDFVFKLPPSYLASSLSISDPRYPNIQIIRYAHVHNIDLQTFLISIRQAVSAARP